LSYSIIPSVNRLIAENPDHGLSPGALRKDWVKAMGGLSGEANYLESGPRILRDSYYSRNIRGEKPARNESPAFDFAPGLAYA
jgi:hypothetical protein